MPPSLSRLRNVPVLHLLASLRQRRWFRPAARALAGLLGVWLLAWALVPLLAKGPLERMASAQLGRAVTVGALDFRPWSLELTLRDVVVAGAEGAPPQLTIARIYADGELQSLLRWAPVVDALQVDAPHLRLAHLGDGRYDADDVLARLAAPAPQPDNGPARLALYNLALHGGQVDFDDRTVNVRHEVRGLDLTVPFISTLPSQREVQVRPHLAFILNGSRFDTAAEGTPFAQTGDADARVRWEGLDLQPYLAYLPASVPVKLRSATLDLDVKVDFQQRPQMAAAFSGWVQARQVNLADSQGQDLLALDRLRVDIADLRPLHRKVHLSKVALSGAHLHARRDAAGNLNWAQRLAPAAPTGAAPSARPTPAWSVAVDEVAVQGSTLHWADATTRPALQLPVQVASLQLRHLAWPLTPTPATLRGALELPGGGRLALAGSGTDRQAELTLTADALDLGLAAPYLATVLEPTVAGRVNGALGLRWVAEGRAGAGAPAPAVAPLPAASAATSPTVQAASEPAPPATAEPSNPAQRPGLTWLAGPLTIDQFALRRGRDVLAAWDRLELAGLAMDPARRTAALQRLALAQPRVQVERDAQGRWMVERWLRAAGPAPAQLPLAPDAAAPVASEASATALPADAPWQWRIEDLAVQGGSVALADHSQPRPVAVQLAGLTLAARNLASDGGAPQAFSLSTRMAAPGRPGHAGGAGEPGRLDFQGTLGLQPLALEGQLNATRLPLQALDGYLAGQWSIEVLRADASFRGQAAWAHTAQGPRLRLQGDAALDDLRALSTAASTPKTAAQVDQELLSWKNLSLRGLSVATAPGTAPRVEVRETSLSDFFARVTVNEAGRLNLSDIAQPPAQAAATAAALAAAPASAPTPAPAQPAVQPPAPSDPLSPVVAWGPVSLVNGKVLFSDFFVQPNYTANLSELTGRLGAFRSDAPLAGNTGEPALADLELRGRAEGSAALEITGRLNPLARTLALDITGKVQGLELPPLSPYAVKYAGHGIERGKLSMDVNYQVLPNGQLTASNRLVLNQLTFGEPVAGAPASLPVKLAVSLLADRNGVIDLELPISGSLNDPQFRLGPVIGKLVLNLIGKALTSPFSLLAGALGGSDAALGHVAFAPGSAVLTDEARQNLDKVAQALAERPSLQLTVTGTASAAQEREGLLRARLAQQLLAEKRRATPADATPVQPHEVPALLRAVYRRADMPKPRNLVGLAKELSEPEMEALLLAQFSATEAQAAELAAQRAQAVRDYLTQQRQLPAERLFVAAPKSGPRPEPWMPRAELSLATR
ncbi:DUF748 domain-containing protein [Acidovorax sp.]|uniref:DUF748 domain-containing protein n=1 Tax=Acidovorax sp. TaxID=1872122 RepID=UPI00391DF5E0